MSARSTTGARDRRPVRSLRIVVRVFGVTFSRAKCVLRTKATMKTRSTIDRAKLDGATLEQLQKEAKKLGLEISGDRSALIESILNHLERIGPMDLPAEAQGAASEAEQENRVTLTESPLTAGALHQALSTMTASIMRQQREWQAQQQQLFLQQQTQFGEWMQRLLERGESREAQRAPSQDEGPTMESAGPSGSSASMSPATGDTLRSHTTPPGNIVSWIASQIPEYSGAEEENVLAWIRRVDKV